VEEHLVTIDLDHRATDDLPVLDRHHRLLVGLVEAQAAEIVVDDLAWDVLGVAHGCDRIVLRLGLGGSGGGVGHVGTLRCSSDGGRAGRVERAATDPTGYRPTAAPESASAPAPAQCRKIADFAASGASPGQAGRWATRRNSGVSMLGASRANARGVTDKRWSTRHPQLRAS